MAEDFGVEDRGSFYDPVGALRDVVQNHLLQVLALVAMEPPSGGPADPDPIRDRKADLFRAMPDADPGRYVRGQYRAISRSTGSRRTRKPRPSPRCGWTIDNWRWAGVPFFIRAGKALPVESTEVRVVFKSPPRLGIGGRMVPDPDELVLRIKPEPGAELCLLSKKPGADALQRVHLDLLFEAQVGDQPEPYERLLRDAMIGDSASVSDPGGDRGDLADRPAAARRPGRRSSPTPPAPGARRRPATCSHGHGGWRKPWLSE